MHIRSIQRHAVGMMPINKYFILRDQSATNLPTSDEGSYNKRNTRLPLGITIPHLPEVKKLTVKIFLPLPTKNQFTDFGNNEGLVGQGEKLEQRTRNQVHSTAGARGCHRYPITG